MTPPDLSNPAKSPVVIPYRVQFVTFHATPHLTYTLPSKKRKFIVHSNIKPQKVIHLCNPTTLNAPVDRCLQVKLRNSATLFHRPNEYWQLYIEEAEKTT